MLTNEHMPGLVKIGRTRRGASERARELYQTGVPSQFIVFFEVYSPDCAALENQIHNELIEQRVSSGREFFAISAAIASSRLAAAHKEQVGCWLDDFMPGVVISDPDIVVDEGGITFIAYQLDSHPRDIAAAMCMLTADEVRPGLERWQEVLSRSSRIANMNKSPDA